MEWALFYRMQKIREAEGRVTTRKMELADAQNRSAALRKAHLHNAETREQLFARRQNLIKNLPKEAIVSADIPWEQKKTLFADWYAEHEHSAKHSKEKTRERDQDRDPTDH